VPTEFDELTRLVATGKFDSFSSVLRAGLGYVARENGQLPQTDLQIERERRMHPPRFGRPPKPVKIAPVAKNKKGDPKKMSAIRRRKSSV
jgi:Arc/MetJ-type ribon-helix-helix transcriptional regulator